MQSAQPAQVDMPAKLKLREEGEAEADVRCGFKVLYGLYMGEKRSEASFRNAVPLPSGFMGIVASEDARVRKLSSRLFLWVPCGRGTVGRKQYAGH